MANFARSCFQSVRWGLTASALACTVCLPVWADQSLATQKNCMGCHALERKMVGPSYKDVAKKYAADPSAADKLALKIQKGGAGVWGPVPMPSNPQVNEKEAKTLASWILSLK
ncbi:MAG: c-type cytochrome [Pseudomonadota bacterium]|nr:c-type cytochrome [Pseudomonadota bacterium]